MRPEPSSADVAAELIINLGIPLLLLFCAWLLQHRVVRSRRKYLDEQEKHFREVLQISNLKQFPAGGKFTNPVLVAGSAAVANNYFVSFLAGFKHVFGGEVKGYTQLCSDARRLALVRMYQEAEAAGANAVFNIRFETSTIISANNQKESGGVELIAYGTAVRLEP